MRLRPSVVAEGGIWGGGYHEHDHLRKANGGSYNLIRGETINKQKMDDGFVVH